MRRKSQFRLLVQRRFGPFFLTQLGGAFNDNLLKQVLVQLVTFHAADYTTLAPGLVTNLAAGIFILPFALFSSLAGELADRYDKAYLIRTVKVAEVAIMAIAAAGFYAHSLAVLLLALFLMGTHSTFFGPAKYSLLPRVLAESELVGGNGLLEMGTFAAILAGMLCASVLVAHTTDPRLLTLALMFVAVFGLACSLFIPLNGCAAPDLEISVNLVLQTVDIVRRARRNRVVWLSLLAISWFWFFGAAILTQLPVLVLGGLHAGEDVLALLLAIFTIGVATGSLLCDRLSGGRVEWGLVPLGSLGMTLFAADACWVAGGFVAAPVPRDIAALVHAAGGLRLLADIVLLGAFGGIFSVPLYATVQARSQSAEQSRVIAANNILNALFMVIAAGMGVALTALGATAAQIIGVCAVLNALAAVALYRQIPEFAWRFCVWILARTCYRVRHADLQTVPASGGALLLAGRTNALAGALVLSAASPRPVRFAVESRILRTPIPGALLRAAAAIPIASAQESPDAWAASRAAMTAALAAGELLCVFGIEGSAETLQHVPVPAIPLVITGLAASSGARCNPLGRRIEIRAGEAAAT